jgi:hypothetical protein
VTHHRHLTRAAAAEDLFRLGDGAIPHVRKAADALDGERKDRLRAILEGWMDRTGFSEPRLLRAVHLLTIVGTPEAKDVLDRIKKALP